MCARTLEMSWFRPLEMSGFKDGLDFDERDLRRIEVLSEVRAGRRTVAAAAAVLAVSERQAYRLLARYEVDGGSGLIHKGRGRTSNRSRNEGIRKYAVELVKTRWGRREKTDDRVR